MNTLRDFVSSNIGKEKVVFTCEKKETNRLLDLLALDGVPVFGVSVFTVEEYLKNVLLPKKIKLITTEESLKLLSSTIASLQSENRLSYYVKGLKISTEKILQAIENVRLSDYVVDFSVDGNSRINDFRIILSSYVESKKERKLVDYADVLEICKISSKNIDYAIIADTVVHYKEREFLKNFDNLTVINSVMRKGQHHLPANFFSDNPEDYSEFDIMTLSGKANYASYYIRTDEIISIFTRIVEREISPQDVEIVYADDDMLSIIKTYANLFGINIDVSCDETYKSSEIYSFIELLSDFINSRGRFTIFEKIIKLNLFSTEIINIQDMSTELAEKKFYAGLDNYSSADVNNNNFLEDFKALIPKNFYSEIDFFVELKKLSDFLKTYLSEENYAKNRKIFSCLEDSESDFIEDRIVSYELFTEMLKRRITSIPKEKTSPIYPYAIVRSIRSIQPFTRKTVFLCGLVAGNFPTEIPESPILNDKEYRFFSDSIMTSVERNEIEQYNIIKTISSFTYGMELNMSFSRYDIFNETENVSAILFDRLAGKNVVKHGLISAELIDDVSGDCLTNDAQIDWKVRENTEERKAELRDWIGTFKFSQTSIELLMKCPKCFYFKYIEGFPRAENDLDDEGAWLDSLLKGNVVHEIFDDFIKRVKTRKSVSIESCEKKLDELLKTKLEKTRAIVPPLRKRVYEEESEAISDMVKGYFEVEFANKIGEIANMESEKSFYEIIDIGKYRINISGKIDRLEKDGNVFKIVDMKTGKRKNIEKKAFRDELYQDYVYTRALEKYAERIVQEYHFLGEKVDSMYLKRELSAEDIKKIDVKIERVLDFIVEYGFVSCEDLDSPPEEYSDLKRSRVEIEDAHKYSEFKLICRRSL